MPEATNETESFRIVVVGDNSAQLGGSWLNVLGPWLSERYNRAVLVQQAADSNGEIALSPPVSIGGGTGLPIQVINLSMPDRNPQYFDDHFVDFARIADLQTANVILYDQGHNAGTRTLAAVAIRTMTKYIAAAPKANVTAILQNPELPSSSRAKTHSLNILDLKTSCKNAQISTLDLFDLFNKQANLKSLLNSDGIFPNGTGYLLWASAIENYFAQS